MSVAVSKLPGSAASGEILCGCVDLSRSDFAALVADDPAAGFDTLLDRTGAGRKCTACMLDLEYLFTELPRDESAAKRLAVGDVAITPSLSFKRRLYALLDGIPLTVPQNVTNWMPVFYGGGIE